jgi:Family of unknown function (DUF6526)
MQGEQNYANHARYLPLYHFIVVPLFALHFLVTLVYAFFHARDWMSWWRVVVAVALLLLVWAARLMALTVQNRVIRLEERLRLQHLLPDDLRSRAAELRTSQLIALRFCSDEELPEMCRAVLNGELTSSDEIKRRVKTWRPDWLRA